MGVSNYGRKFRAQLNRLGRIFYLGVFSTQVEAAQAYDRGSLLSEAWSKRVLQLNFNRPTEALTPESDAEKALMTHLRTYHPQMEDDFREEAEIARGMPEELLSVGRCNVDNLKHLADRVVQNYLDLRNRFLVKNATIRELEIKIEFLEGRNVELQTQLVRQSEQASYAQNPVKMERVVQPPAPLPNGLQIISPLPPPAELEIEVIPEE